MVETCTSRCDLALARAALYRLTGHAFRHPSEGWHAEWRALLEHAGAIVPGAFDSSDASSCLSTAIEGALECPLDSAQVIAEHARVLGHIPRAAATPYETEWTGAAGEFLQYHQISDIAAFYHAFGLQIAKHCDERPDHVSVELEFLHYLCVKEAWAHEHDRADLAELCRDTERRFLAEHLARWAPGLCARIDRASAGGFYSGTAALLRVWLETECHRLEAEPSEPILEPAATSFRPEDACIGCGHSATCLTELGKHDEPRD